MYKSTSILLSIAPLKLITFCFFLELLETELMKQAMFETLIDQRQEMLKRTGGAFPRPSFDPGSEAWERVDVSTVRPLLPASAANETVVWRGQLGSGS